MKTVYVRMKGSNKEIEIQKETVSVELMNIGKGILHIVTKDADYYYPLEIIESCIVRNG